jgi:putative transposase
MLRYDNKVISEFVMEQFSNFFNSYTKSFNKVFGRKGKLFMDHTRRNNIADGSHFIKIVHYIHANPVHHGYCTSVEDWNFSSYNTIIGNQLTQLPKDEILTWFGGREAFIKFHGQPIIRKFKDRP